MFYSIQRSNILEHYLELTQGQGVLRRPHYEFFAKLKFLNFLRAKTRIGSTFVYFSAAYRSPKYRRILVVGLVYNPFFGSYTRNTSDLARLWVG